MLDVSEIRDNLSQVYCQQDSIAQLIDTLEIWHAQIDKAKPLSLLFAGTSGVGKTYTIGLLAEALQPMGYDYCYFAMNEFSQEHTVSNLIGSPKGYVGSEEEPKLFEALKRSKKLVICFDEIEKAHEKILKALMQLMDKGFLSWSKGEGDFRDCILCFTSNAQMQKMVSLKSKFEETSQSIEGPEFQNAIRDILVQAQVAPEVCGRINRFLVYNPLTPKAVIEITHQEVKKLARHYGLEVMYTASEFLAETAEKTANSIYGARPIEQQVSSKLGKSILSIKKDSPSAKQIIIQKSSDGYQAIMVEENAKIPGREEMINTGVKIYQQKVTALFFLDAHQIRDNLSQVYCQQDSIAQLIDTLEIWHAQIDKAKPLSLLFAGTSGVGKTYTIGLLAEALQPMGYDYCYFAMNEFSQEHTVSNLIGSPKGYVGSEEEPKLFEALKRSKKLVICFDEIEKAHEKILKALMQLMDKGFLSWSKGEGDFRDCILCFTSNAQMQKMISLKSKFEETSQSIEGPEFQNAIRDILVQAQVAPEVCGRINRFLVYNPLTPKSVIEITHQEVKKLAKRYGLEVMYTASEFLAETAEKTANSIYGARPIEQHVSSKLGKSILSIKKDSPSAKQIVIQKSSDGYQAIMVEENAKIPGREEMIIEAENLLKKNINNTSAQSTASIQKSKRLLHLSDLPASLPEALSGGQDEKSPMESKELENVLSSVGYIQVVEKDGQQSSGSGFAITPDGKLITCYHVVENAKSIRVRFERNPETWFPAVYFDGDERADIAILQLKGKEFLYALIDEYDKKVSLGENVSLLGYPLGDELGSSVTFTTGVISSFRRGDDGISLFQIDANAYPGSSGGPLFRQKDGRIIGILRGGLKQEMAVMINFAVSIQEIYKRLLAE